MRETASQPHDHLGAVVRAGARDAESVEAVAEKVSVIFEACSFQDITSQRIRRAIEHLQQVETMLTELAPVSSETTSGVRPAPDLAQDDVDRLFD